jgi:hypothetical protein
MQKQIIKKNWLADKAMLANVNISQWTARRLDRQITDEVNNAHGATKDAGRYNKLLIAKEALAPIQVCVSRARVLHLKMTQPWIDLGARLLPAALYVDYTKQMQEQRVAFEAAADKFARDYPKHVEKRRRSLGSIFKPQDYPDPSRMRSLFEFDVAIMPCPDPDDFRVALAAEHAEDIKADIEARLQRAVQDAMRDPFNRVTSVVGALAEKLRAYKPAEKKGEKSEGVFRDSLVENVRELVAILPAFNLTDDTRLHRMIADIETHLCAADANDLREHADLREDVADRAEEILRKAQMFIA